MNVRRVEEFVTNFEGDEVTEELIFTDSDRVSDLMMRDNGADGVS